MRSHGHVQAALISLVERTGMYADRERYVPELYAMLPEEEGETRTRKAIMDVAITCPGVAELLLVDVSVRAASASRYSRSTAAGVAAAAGEKEKMQRYGAAVLPMVFELGGRMGPASRQTLETIITTAATARLCHGFAASRWRCTLEKAVLFGAADAHLRALGAGAGGGGGHAAAVATNQQGEAAGPRPAGRGGTATDDAGATRTTTSISSTPSTPSSSRCS